MGKQQKRLGRGLDSLISDVLGTEQPGAATASKPPVAVTAEPSKAVPSDVAHRVKTEASPLQSVPLPLVDANPYQPRGTSPPGGIAELAASIRQNGLLQPIAVRRLGERYQIIAGERRFLAAKEAGLAQIPAIVREATDSEMLELALLENIQREDLNPIDRANGYRTYCVTFQAKVEDLARKLGEDRSTVANYVRLLELSETVQELVQAGVLGMGHARALLAMRDEQQQVALAQLAVTRSLSVRELEARIRQSSGASAGNGSGAVRSPARPAHVREMERRLEQAVQTRVTIREGKRKGSGRIIIEYHSLDDFDRIAELLGAEGE